MTRPPALPWPDQDDAHLWLDDSLRVLHINRAGHRLLADHPDLLALEADVLQVRTASPRWPAALAMARAGQGAALALPTPHRPRLSLLLTPGNGVRTRASLLLRCRVHRLLQIDTTTTRQVFALTRREAEVVSALANGLATTEIATQLQVQTNTVQAHAKSAMAKLGVKHQAALVALLWRSVAALPTAWADGAARPPDTPRAAGDAPECGAKVARLGKDGA